MNLTNNIISITKPHARSVGYDNGYCSVSSCLMVGIHTSGISIPLSPLMFLG